MHNYDYEGSEVVSVHRSEASAIEAAATYVQSCTGHGFKGKCAMCNETLLKGVTIYYSRPYAYCCRCGEAKFEPHFTQAPMPSEVSNTPADEVATEEAPMQIPVRVVTAMPLTTQNCYCHLVKRKCGVCVANSMLSAQA